MTRLEEGRFYIFNPVKIVELPGGERNLVLIGPDEHKYLLPVRYYNNYNLTIGSEIRCKIDKINCSGKVFLEPEHPFFREGVSYSFTVESSFVSLNEAGKTVEEVVVNDGFGNTITLPPGLVSNVPAPGTRLSLQIEHISKGKIYFQSKKEPENMGGLEEGVIYEFRIDRIAKGTDDEDSYVAIDDFGGEHTLQVRYYAHYGFKIGTIFKGKVIRYNSKGRRTIEPENPWYKPGDILDVTVTECLLLETGEGYLAEVFDKHGFLHNINLDEKPVSSSLKCRVVKMRKGRPVLALITLT